MSKPKFNNEWHELSFLCGRAMFFMHESQKRDDARAFTERMRTIMASIGHTGEAIIGETALALIAEFDGKWGEGLTHRKNELKLISKLHNSIMEEQKGKDCVEFVLSGRDRETISTEFGFIQMTYKDHSPDNYRKLARHVKDFHLPFS